MLKQARCPQRPSSVFVVTLVAFFFVSVPRSGAQVPSPVTEKEAGDKVATLVAEARRQNGLPKLKRIDDPHLRADACERAQRNDVRTWVGAVGGRVGYISGVAYSTTDPSQPVPELLSFATRKEHWEAHRFAVGVCFVQTAQSPAGRYWVDVESYMGAIQTFFQRPFWS